MSIILISILILSACGSGKDFNEPVSNSAPSDELTAKSEENIDLVEINAFDDIVVGYVGWEGLGKLEYIDMSNCLQFIQDNFEFKPVEDWTNLSNGDEIEIHLIYDKKDVEEKGYIVLEDTKKFKVTGLNSIQQSWGYYDGVAWVNSSKNGWCLCDKEGNILFTLDEGTKPTTNFYNGVSIVDENRLVDKNGNTIWSVDIDGNAYAKQKWGDAVKEIEICYAYGASGRYGKDFFGKVFVHFFINSYELSGDFMGILDSSGNWIFEPEEGYDEVRCYDYGDNGIFEFRTSFGIDKNWFFYNAITDEKIIGRDNAVLDRWKREYYCSIHDGLIFEERDGVGFFCDVDGNEMINLSRYYRIHDNVGTGEFSNGYALLHIANESNYEFYTIIDVNGNEMFTPKSTDDGQTSLVNGFYRIGTQYYNINGAPMFSLVFSECSDFQEEMALVEIAEDKTLHFINTNGEIVY